MVSRRAVLAGVIALPATPVLACIDAGLKLTKAGATPDLVEKLAMVERAAREMRVLLPSIAEIEAATVDDPSRIEAWNLGELDRISTEIDGYANKLRAAVRDFAKAQRLS